MTSQQILQGIQTLEPLPQACLRVMEIASGDGTCPSDLIDVIQTDVAITAKVLRLCNSAYYGFAREVSSLEEAGNMLGVTTLVNLVITACTGKYFKDTGSASQERMDELWERSVTNAICTSLLARLSGEADKNTAYTAGLLQYIGSMLFERFLPEEMQRVHNAVASGRDPIEAELDILGVHHGDVGARLAEQWNFPPALCDCIRTAHDPTQSQEAGSLAWIVHIADKVCEAALNDSDTRTTLSDELFETAGFDRSILEVLGVEIHRELDKAREYLTV